MTDRHYKRGYTLVEIIVVVGLVTLLVSFTAVTFSEYREAARDAQRRSTVEELVKTFNTYQAIHGELPDCPVGLIIEKTSATADFETYAAGSCDDIDAINSFFTNNFPNNIVDPSGAGDRQHVYIYDSEHFCTGGFPSPIPMVFAKMERPENSNRDDVCPSSGNDGGYLTTDGEPTYPFVKGLD